MFNNVCIILLIFLIVYLIYKISSNSCDCFSVGFSVGGNETKCNLNNGICNVECIDEANKLCGVNMNTSNTKNMHSCNDIEESDLVNFAECNDGYSLDVHWNSRGEPPAGDYCIFSCTPSPPPPKISSLKPDNQRQFLADINEAYKDPDSSGVFISIILDGMDGSGSVLNKNIYTNTYSERSCTFGFIWDTNWLTVNDGSLVECLFPTDAGTANFDNTDCNPVDNFCELANTSGSNTPDRCSRGLNFIYHQKNLPYPTSCKQNKIYDLNTMKREKFKKDENCFTYINREIDKSYVNGFNEGVFLKDLKYTSLNYHEGFEKLKKLNKPLPSALLLVYSNNVDCTNNPLSSLYMNELETLKSNFTSDTMVVKAKYDNEKKSIISFDDDVLTTLGEMPGYNDI